VGTVGVGKERLREMPFACNIRLAFTALSKRLWKLRLLCHATGIPTKFLKTKTFFLKPFFTTINMVPITHQKNQLHGKHFDN